MKNPKRTRVVTGIYSDRYGFMASISLGGVRRDKRFPPDAAITFMENWRKRVRADLACDRALQITDRVAETERLTRLPKSEQGWCYVYFVRAGDHVKIGRAVDPAQRLTTLQVSHPVPLSLLAAVPAHATLEAAIHQRFDHLREAGEWFRLEPELFAFIKAIRDGQNPIALLWEWEP